MKASTGYVDRVIAQVEKRIKRRISSEPDISSSSSVTSRWSTTGNKLLAPKSCYAVSALSSLDPNLGTIYEHRNAESESDARRSNQPAPASHE
jgi:hypothetical protein